MSNTIKILIKWGIMLAGFLGCFYVIHLLLEEPLGQTPEYWSYIAGAAMGVAFVVCYHELEK